MTATVRFLERLTPRARQESAVRAALPPRFAPAPAEATLDHEVPAASDQHSPPPAPEHVAPPLPRVEHAPAAPAPIPAWPALVLPERSARAPVASARPELPFGSEPVAPAAPSGDARADVSMRVEHTHRVTHEPASPARGRARAPSGAEPRAVRVVSAPAPPVPPRAPLRETVREQRPLPAKSEAPTVVHVTIDHLEVRVPAGSALPRQTPKRRGGSPTLSLGDYLRQGDRARTGGVP
jgi:hypothetical protein